MDLAETTGGRTARRRRRRPSACPAYQPLPTREVELLVRRPQPRAAQSSDRGHVVDVVRRIELGRDALQLGQAHPGHPGEVVVLEVPQFLEREPVPELRAAVA